MYDFEDVSWQPGLETWQDPSLVNVDRNVPAPNKVDGVDCN